MESVDGGIWTADVLHQDRLFPCELHHIIPSGSLDYYILLHQLGGTSCSWWKEIDIHGQRRGILHGVAQNIGTEHHHAIHLLLDPGAKECGSLG
jgi:hypothetical protein